MRARVCIYRALRQRQGIPIGVASLAAHCRPAVYRQANRADQAVIAIENVRLFDEIQDKSKQLAEASERKSQFLASITTSAPNFTRGWY